MWFRSIRSSLSNWESKVLLLRRVFLLGDYDDQVWEEIKERTLEKNECVAIFIAVIEILFSRLSRSPTEAKVMQKRQNLLLQYYSVVCSLVLLAISVGSDRLYRGPCKIV